MRSVTVAQGTAMLPDLCEAVVRDHEEVVLTGEDGNVVMVSEHDWEITRESLRVLRDPIALRALLAGHRIRDEGRKPEGKTAEEVFDDLVDQHPPAS